MKKLLHHLKEHTLIVVRKLKGAWLKKNKNMSTFI
jgi:hypothetical protein